MGWEQYAVKPGAETGLFQCGTMETRMEQGVTKRISNHTPYQGELAFRFYSHI